MVRGAAFNWVIVPSVTNRYFSPDTTPGQGDTTMYYFAIDDTQNYEVNLTSYFRTINFSGYLTGYSAGYLMPNGTWLVLFSVSDTASGENQFWLGYGEKMSSMQYKKVGRYNSTKMVALAANGTTIQVAYVELAGLGAADFKGLKYYESADWGDTWSGGTIADFSDSPYLSFSGVDVEAFGDEFECAFSVCNVSGTTPNRYRFNTIWQANTTGNIWNPAGNLTTLVGTYASAPQVMVNRTHDNGTYYLAFNQYESDKVTSRVFELGDGVGAQETAYWNLTSPSTYSSGDAMVFVGKENGSDLFWFYNRLLGGFQNATWGTNLYSRPVDYFSHNFYYNTFMYAQDGPKFFSGSAVDDKGRIRPGTIEGKFPFTVLHLTGAAAPYTTVSHVWDGKDAFGSSRGASAYRFYLTVGTGASKKTNELDVFVDPDLPYLSVDNGSCFISPTTSPGTQDSFDVHVVSDGEGEASIEVFSDKPVNETWDVTDGVNMAVVPELCGDGIRNYLFYTESEGNDKKFMFSTSSDGGLSWSSPRVLKTFTSTGLFYRYKKAAISGTNIYCWAETETAAMMLNSPDSGTTFVTHDLVVPPDEVTSDLSCWRGFSNGTHFVLNRSTDLGFNYEEFLAIPQNYSVNYTYLDGAAYDPVSKNYSFIIDNSLNHTSMFVTTTDDGSSYAKWETIGMADHVTQSGYRGLMDLDLRRKPGTNSNEWVISGTIMHETDMAAAKTIISYSATDGGGAFSEWEDLSISENEPLKGAMLTFNLENWDLFYPENYSVPLFTTSVYDSVEAMFNQIEVEASSSLVFETSDSLGTDHETDLSFSGFDSSGKVLEDGMYDWRVVVTDRAGNSVERWGVVFVDNSVPKLGSHANFTSPAFPLPQDPTTVTIPVVEEYPGNGVLYFRTGDEGWEGVPMDVHVEGSGEYNYTATIPADDQVPAGELVYWKVVVTDLAGNTLVVDNNGSYFSFKQPSIRFELQTDVPGILDLSAQAKLEVILSVPEDAEYLSRVYVEYSFDDGGGTRVVNLTSASGLTYNFTLTLADIPRNATELNFTIVGVDIFGNLVTMDQVTVELVPALPSWEVTSQQRLFMLVVSLLVGVACGAIYSAFTSRKSGAHLVSRRLLESGELARDRHAVAGTGAEMGAGGEKRPLKATMLLATLVGIAATSVLAVLWFARGTDPELTILLFGGVFLLSTFLWVLLSDSSVETTLRSQTGNVKGRHGLFLLLAGFLIYASMLMIFVTGNTIAWWRVRLNEQAYSLGGFQVSKTLVSATTMFLSSILLLTWSTTRNVKTTARELAESVERNENPLAVAERRENAIKKIMRSVGNKGIVFVTLIAATIIFASDLSAYASQGLFIIVPFVAGAVGTLLLVSWRQRSGKDVKGVEEAVVFDLLTECPQCHAATPLGGTYCEACGARLVGETRASPGVYCTQCGKLNTSGMKHCRYCGAELKGTP
ncbi:MAG: zinc ribbon domain-containing protein [Promethearchaeota archaeon]